MSEVIDISLHRTALGVLDELLEARGLAFFLKRAGALPFATDERRVGGAGELACRRLSHAPVDSARAGARRAVRRRVIALVAEAMVQVGF